MQKNIAFLTDMGKRIAKYRKANGLSQDELAEAAGISPKTVSAAESGQKALRPENIVSICHVLELDIGYLLTGRYSLQSIFHDDRLKVLDAKQLEALKTIVDSFLTICN